MDILACGRGLEANPISSITTNVGHHSAFVSTEEQLEHMEDLEDGAYQILFSRKGGGHSITLIKESPDEVYLLDTNHGLLGGCNFEIGKKLLLYLLSQYQPPDGQKNYQLRFIPYTLPKPSERGNASNF